MLYRSRGRLATANIKRAALQNKSDAFVLGRGTTSVETLCRFPPKGTCAYANPFTPFRFFLKNAVSKKRTAVGIFKTRREKSRGPHKILLYLWGIKTSNSRRFKGFSSVYANPFTPFAFFEKRGFQKKNSGKYYDRTGKRTNFKENEKS